MRRRTIFDVDQQLATSARRTAEYLARGDHGSVAIERHVQNRLLDERNAMRADQ